jgi:enamine deaminase RidA (YjgF/YER057c/UK114 family)
VGARLSGADRELAFVGRIAPAEATLAGDAHAQASVALDALERALSARGLGLADLLRLRLFLADRGELPAVERALSARLGSERPATSVVELPASADTGSSRPRPAVSLDAVAAPGARADRRLAERSARLGPWVFLGAVSAREPTALFARVTELLAEQSAGLGDVVKVGLWLGFPMRDYGPLARVRAGLTATTGLLPASAGVQAGRAGLAGELIACEAIAYAPAHARPNASPAPGRPDAPSATPDLAAPASSQPPSPAPSRLASFYTDMRAAGGHVFTSGEVADGPGSAGEQAAETYARLRAHLAAADTSPAAVLHQTVFVRRAGGGEAVEEAARAFYGPGARPPTTLLTVADLGFAPGREVEIELIARTGG